MEPREEWLQVNLPNPSFRESASKKECTPPFPPPPVRFGLKTGIHFAHFGLESGMVFEGTTGMYERISIVSIPNDR